MVPYINETEKIWKYRSFGKNKVVPYVFLYTIVVLTKKKGRS